MDVRCERCRTEYEFDDAKITETGVTVKCTVCGHVFKVRRKALVVTEPIRREEVTRRTTGPIQIPEAARRSGPIEPLGEAARRAGTIPAPGEFVRRTGPIPAQGDRREWKVRQASGNLFTFQELTTLQKWIVERKVTRDDEISLTGESWKRLGNIAELATFFQVVEAADRATSAPGAGQAFAPSSVPPPQAQVPFGFAQAAPLAGVPAQLPVGLTPASVPAVPGAGAGVPTPAPASPHAAVTLPGPALPPPPPVVTVPGVPLPQEVTVRVALQPMQPMQPELDQTIRAPAWDTQPQSQPVVSPAEANEPRFSRMDDTELEPDELALVRGGGKAKWAVLLVVLAGAGVGAWRYLKPKPPEPPEATAKPGSTAPIAPEPNPIEESPQVAAKPADAGAEARPAENPAEAKAPEPKPAQKPAEAKAPEPGPAEKPAEKPPAAKTDRPPKGETAAPAGKGFDWYVEQGNAKRERNQPKAALALYENAAELDPDSAEPDSGRGYCLFDLGDTDGAIAAFQAALKKNPRFSDAILGLAESYREKGDKKRAIEFYRKYVDEAPNGPEVDLARGNIERLSKD